MGKKYIIELNPDCVAGEYLRFPFSCNAGEQQWFVTKATLTPYTEPDLEQVRKEAYEEGKKQAKVQAELDICHDIEKVAKENYKAGLADAWEAARKIVTMPDRDFINSDILDLDPGESIFTKYTASEAIEKIRKYEQEQEEQIQVGDEVIATSGKAVIVSINDDKDKARYIYHDSTLGFDKVCNLSKTGRHFPEIVAVLEKMRGEQE